MVVIKFPVRSEIFIYNQALSLLDSGHDVDLIVLNGKERKNDHFPTSFELKSKASQIIYLSGRRRFLLSYSLKMILQKPLQWKLWIKWFSAFRKKNLLVLKEMYVKFLFYDKNSYDIVHCQFGHAAKYFLTYRDIPAFSGPWVVAFRGWDIWGYVSKYSASVYDELKDKLTLALPNCDAFYSRLLALDFDPLKISILGSPVRVDEFPYQCPEPPLNGQARLLFVGRFVQKKGVVHLIEAVNRLRIKHPEIKLDLIGMGPEQAKYEKLVDEKKLTEIIYFCGPKEHGEILSYMRRAHIFVSLNVQAENGDVDAGANTIKEAMLAGLPVVTSPVGGIPELFPEEGMASLVPAGNVDAAVDALSFLIEHPENWKNMTKKSSDFIRKTYNSKTLNEKLLYQYRKVINLDCKKGE